MKFPKWVCITCGKPSSRKWNIKRHIQICHTSIGRYVSFMEYMTGRQNGLYQPSQYPNSFYGSSKNKVNLPEKMIEEFSIELARQLALLYFNPHSSIQPECCWQQDHLANTDLARKCNQKRN
jgi:hypothetical protein